MMEENQQSPGTILFPLLFTVLIYIVSEIVNSTLLPMTGIVLGLNFTAILTIFFSLKFDSIWVPPLILLLGLIHGLFSVEGWPFITFVAIIVHLILGRLNEIVLLNSKLFIIVLTLVVLVFWYFLGQLLMFLKTDNFNFYSGPMKVFLFESLVLAFLSPFLYKFLGVIWKSHSKKETSGT